ncbi:hypothetical protein ACSBR1_018274 [Camellia fascicularis]
MGAIPTSIFNISSLQSLSLSENNLSSNLSSSIGLWLPNLSLLYLGVNNLIGIIPESILNASKLIALDLGWEILKILEINLSSNSLTGNLPPQLGSFKVAILIDFSMNQFTGKIPSTIIGLQNLVTLSLAHNKLQGSIPDSFGSMLKGQIPNGGPSANFTIQSFMSNEALCSAPKFQVPLCHTSSFHHLRKERMALTLYILLPIASILLATTFVFLFIKCQRRNRTPSNVDLLPTITPPTITYQQLFRATNGFSECNLLGMGSFGSVYKAILEDTTVLAIKVFNFQVEGAFKSFDIECEIMRHIRHRNLTKVISSCSSLDFKALVLEYMSNGSLEKWLYSYNYFLDMLQRLDIMIDVALAINSNM